MDFNDSPQDAAFRKEVQTWLAANAAEYKRDASEGAQSSQRAAKARSEEEQLQRARTWQKKKAAAGYAA